MHSTIPEGLRAESLEWLPVEASGRRYARLHRVQGVAAATAVLMVFPPRTRAAEVERVARCTRLLAQAELPVPAIHRVAAGAGWILQEDLGDLSLAVARARGMAVAPAYSEAVALLGRLAPLRLDTSPKPPLDGRRLLTELQQFTSLALHLGDGPGPALGAELQRLVEACLELPQVLCHRDYHSRNLHLHEGRVRFIDHQDALPGPACYDRVSLAYDPYVELPDEVRDRIAGDAPGVIPVAVQRLAKAIGTFADKGGAWLRCIAPAARQARRLLAADERPWPMLDLAFASLAAASASRPLRQGADA